MRTSYNPCLQEYISNAFAAELRAVAELIDNRAQFASERADLETLKVELQQDINRFDDMLGALSNSKSAAFSGQAKFRDFFTKEQNEAKNEKKSVMKKLTALKKRSESNEKKLAASIAVLRFSRDMKTFDFLKEKEGFSSRKRKHLVADKTKGKDSVGTSGSTGDSTEDGSQKERTDASAEEEEEHSGSDSGSSQKTKRTRKDAKNDRSESEEKMPKRNKTPYAIFCKEARPRVKRENPKASSLKVGQLLQAQWKAMSAEEKAPYEAMAAEDKRRYETELQEYQKRKRKRDEDKGGGASREQEAEADGDGGERAQSARGKRSKGREKDTRGKGKRDRDDEGGGPAEDSSGAEDGPPDAMAKAKVGRVKQNKKQRDAPT